VGPDVRDHRARHVRGQPRGVRRLREAGLPGAIVNISSIAGKVAFATQADYCAAKAAVLGLTRAAALDLAPHGITVNATRR